MPYVNIKAFEKGIFENYTDGIKCNLCENDDLLMVLGWCKDKDILVKLRKVLLVQH